MCQVLRQVTVLVALYVMLKQSFAFLPSFVLGNKSVWKINVDKFSIHHPLSCHPGTILGLRISFRSLFLLPYSSNPDAPMKEHTNPTWLDHIRSHPIRWLTTQTIAEVGPLTQTWPLAALDP